MNSTFEIRKEEIVSSDTSIIINSTIKPKKVNTVLEKMRIQKEIADEEQRKAKEERLASFLKSSETNEKVIPVKDRFNHAKLEQQRLEDERISKLKIVTSSNITTNSVRRNSNTDDSPQLNFEAKRRASLLESEKQAELKKQERLESFLNINDDNDDNNNDNKIIKSKNRKNRRGSVEGIWSGVLSVTNETNMEKLATLTSKTKSQFIGPDIMSNVGIVKKRIVKFEKEIQILTEQVTHEQIQQTIKVAIEMEKMKKKRTLIKKDNNKINNDTVVSCINDTDIVIDKRISVDTMDFNIVNINNCTENPSTSNVSLDDNLISKNEYEVLSPCSDDNGKSIDSNIRDSDEYNDSRSRSSSNYVYDNEADDDEPFYLGATRIYYSDSIERLFNNSNDAQNITLKCGITQSNDNISNEKIQINIIAIGMKTLNQRTFVAITILTSDELVNHPSVFGKYKLAVFPPSNGVVNVEDEPLFERIINITDPNATLLGENVDKIVIFNDIDSNDTNHIEDESITIINESTIITNDIKEIDNDNNNDNNNYYNYNEIKKVVIEEIITGDSIEKIVKNNQQIYKEKTIIQHEPVQDKEINKFKKDEEGLVIVKSNNQANENNDKNDNTNSNTNNTINKIISNSDEDSLVNLANTSAVPFNFGLSSSLVSSHTPIIVNSPQKNKNPIKKMDSMKSIYDEDNTNDETSVVTMHKDWSLLDERKTDLPESAHVTMQHLLLSDIIALSSTDNCLTIEKNNGSSIILTGNLRTTTSNCLCMVKDDVIFEWNRGAAKSGYLTMWPLKSDNTIVSGRKTKFFVIRNNTLYWYKSMPGTNDTTVNEEFESCMQLTSESTINRGRKYIFPCLTISSLLDTLWMRCGTKQSLQEEWIDEIRAGINQCRKKRLFQTKARVETIWHHEVKSTYCVGIDGRIHKGNNNDQKQFYSHLALFCIDVTKYPIDFNENNSMLGLFGSSADKGNNLIKRDFAYSINISIEGSNRQDYEIRALNSFHGIISQDLGSNLKSIKLLNNGRIVIGGSNGYIATCDIKAQTQSNNSKISSYLIMQTNHFPFYKDLNEEFINKNGHKNDSTITCFCYNEEYNILISGDDYGGLSLWYCNDNDDHLLELNCHIDTGKALGGNESCRVESIKNITFIKIDIYDDSKIYLTISTDERLLLLTINKLNNNSNNKKIFEFKQWCQLECVLPGCKSLFSLSIVNNINKIVIWKLIGGDDEIYNDSNNQSNRSMIYRFEYNKTSFIDNVLQSLQDII